MRSTSHIISCDNFAIERELYTSGFNRIGGCDEAGRGPLAGPVVAGCVVLPTHCDHTVFLDSKIISHAKRVALLELLNDIGAITGIGIVSPSTIDKINIFQASLLAMQRAVEDLPVPLDFLLVDGKFETLCALPQRALIKGESKSASIAAASIVAKVKRDALMCSYHEEYPQYNFKKHKGYPTKAHRQALLDFGPCPIHRKSFKGVRERV